MAPKRATLKDVAERAGVSYQTVSRVVNAKGEVLPATRKRVKRVLRELHYRPSMIARSMVAGRAFTLGCISPNLTDYTFACLIEGAEAYARERGYLLLSASAGRVEDVARFCDDVVKSGRVDGVLVINPYADARRKYVEAMHADGIPVVYLGARPRRARIPSVHLDDEDAGHRATRHLLSLGHTRIATIIGPRNEDCVVDRLDGYRRALAEANISVSKKWIGAGDWSASSGYAAMKRILKADAECTGLVAQNDRMAVGAIRALRERGCRVPEDVSVISFDDMPLAAYFDPPLTTMRQDTFRIGQRAAELMLRLLKNPNAARERISIPAELVIRASTRALSPEKQRR